jgi:hypothetical protein
MRYLRTSGPVRAFAIMLFLVSFTFSVTTLHLPVVDALIGAVANLTQFLLVLVTFGVLTSKQTTPDPDLSATERLVP